MTDAVTANADGDFLVQNDDSSSLMPGSVIVNPISGRPSFMMVDGIPLCDSLTSDGTPSGTVVVSAGSPAGTKRWLTNNSQTLVLISELRLTLKMAALDLDGFGGEASALATGISIRVEESGGSTLLRPFTQAPIKTSAQFLTIATGTRLTETSTDEVLVGTFALPRVAIVPPGGRIEIEVGDSLASTDVQAAVSAWILASQQV